MHRFTVPLVLAVGAVALAVIRGPVGVTWNATPFIVGVVALAAAAVAPRPKPWTGGIILTIWGIAVLLVREGPLPNREASVFLIAVALGLLIASLVATPDQQGQVARGGALVILSGGLLFYLAFDVSWLTQWWVFAGGLAVAATVEAARATRAAPASQGNAGPTVSD